MVDITSVMYEPKTSVVIPIGYLASDDTAILFEYDRDFHDRGISLNPYWNQQLQANGPLPSPGGKHRLHGVFHDTLPDAWGRAVLRRRLADSGIDFETLPPITQLRYIGTYGPGALSYRPSQHETSATDVDLDAMAHEASRLLEGADVADISRLAALAGSSGGARPKILVERLTANRMRAFDETASNGDEAWIVKLPSRYDPIDIGPLEAAYADMAREAGLSIMETACLPSPTLPYGYFATRRFDRARQRRRHFTSVAGLLDLEWSEPSIDYHDLLKIVRFVTRRQAEVEAMFRRMIFNIAAHNRDDHTKQHAFFNNFDGSWELTPAYDLTYAPGPGGEHYLALKGRGKAITRNEVIALGIEHHIAKQRCAEILDAVVDAVSNFVVHADRYGTSAATKTLVRHATGRCISLLR